MLSMHRRHIQQVKILEIDKEARLEELRVAYLRRQEEILEQFNLKRRALIMNPVIITELK